MKFKDIPQFTRGPSYQVNVDWKYLELQLANWAEKDEGTGGLDLDPDFQRCHVWTEQQQIAYVEFCLKGGASGKEILFNSPDWGGNYKRPTVLVDGKQRLEAVRKFLRNELPIFGGHYFKEYEDRLPNFKADFIFKVNDLKTKKEVLQWYLDLNFAGTPHTNEELDRVKKLLEKQK